MGIDAKTLERKSASSVRLLILLALGAILYAGRAAFEPVAIAALLALVLSGPVEALHGLKVPRVIGALLILLLIGAAAAGLVNLLSEPAKHWYSEAPHTLRVVARKMRPVEQFVLKIDDLRTSASRMASPPRAETADTQASPAPSAPAASTPAVLFDATLGAMLDTTTVVVLTLFLLAGGPPMLARMTAALASGLNAAHVLCVIEKIRREVGRFYVTTTLINVGLGLATGLAMLLCKMPNPFLWGTLAGVLNFIPYAGPTASFLILSVVALVSFNDLAHVAIVSGSFVALTVLEGQCIQPLLVGRRLQLHPLLVFLALWFGGFLWGLAGIVLATPVLATLKVIAEHSTHGAPWLRFLSPDPRESETLDARAAETPASLETPAPEAQATARVPDRATA